LSATFNQALNADNLKERGQPAREQSGFCQDSCGVCKSPAALQFQKKDFFTSRPPAIKTEKGSIPGSTFGRNPRSARRSGFPLQVLRLPAVVVRALRFNPLRGAKGSPYRSLTGILLKRSL
ncbi:MAG: hypothetical protein LBH90_06745, partial [Tannerella sp.]|nr:hypothetical protein [Tannerella sp.]